MSTRSNSAQSSPLVSDERMRNVLRLHIQRAIHVDRTHTRAELAEQSGVNIYQIDAINAGEGSSDKHRPVHMTEALSLAFVIGPRAVSALVGLIGYVATPKDSKSENEPMRLVSECMTDLSAICTAAADNRFDHTERPEVERRADHMIEILTPISSRGHLG